MTEVLLILVIQLVFVAIALGFFVWRLRDQAVNSQKRLEELLPNIQKTHNDITKSMAILDAKVEDVKNRMAMQSMQGARK